MELTLAFFGSAAIGSLLGLLAKEGIDFLRSEKSHRNEMQRRFFDAKLDATIRVIRQLKSNTSTVRTVFNMMRENDETNGWIHPDLWANTIESLRQTINRIHDETSGMVAAVGFYYDDALVRLIGGSATPPVRMLQQISELRARTERLNATRQLLENTPDAPAELRATVEEQANQQSQEIRLLIADLARFSDAIDEISNQVIRRMRDEYKNVRF